MERKALQELGIEDSLIDGVMKLLNADIDPLKSSLSAMEQERDGLKGQVKERDKQIQDLSKNNANNEDLQSQIKELQSKNDETTKNYQAELDKVKLGNAIELALRDNKAKDSKAVMPFIDTDTIKLDDKGKLVGLSEQLENIKSDHDFLFESDKPKEKELGIQTVAHGNPGNKQPEKVDFSKMSYDDLVKLRKENPEAYEAARNNQK